MMRLLVGLGNPGPEYALTRHNVGFMLVDVFAALFHFPPFKIFEKALISEKSVQGERLVLCKPLTYMNLSGGAVGGVTRFYKIPLDSTIVLHDDLDLPFRTLKSKKGGGDGGHKGLIDITRVLGAEYWRVRFGVDRPLFREQVSSYVLSPFSADERKEIPDILAHVCDYLSQWILDPKAGGIPIPL